MRSIIVRKFALGIISLIEDSSRNYLSTAAGGCVSILLNEMNDPIGYEQKGRFEWNGLYRPFRLYILFVILAIFHPCNQSIVVCE